jgi:hypothetical protein
MLILLVVVAAATLVVPAGAVIVDLDAATRGPFNPVALSLPAGTYTITPIDQSTGGAYTAWLPWGIVGGCDANGENCFQGWFHSYRVQIDSGPTADYYNPGFFGTANQAFANAVTAVVTLSTAGVLKLWIPDSLYSDNGGGVSLHVTDPPLPVLPTTWGSVKALYR